MELTYWDLRKKLIELRKDEEKNKDMINDIEHALQVQENEDLFTLEEELERRF